MASDNIIPLPVKRPPPKRDVFLCTTPFEGELEICNSARFFLTPEGPECVYCGELARDWMEQ